jgi:hypothetical protein
MLTRGCGVCSFQQSFLLPELSKTVIYLDQSFFSHAFRDELKEFKTCISLIIEAAHNQLLVCPRSSLHETETFQWRDKRSESLWEFIKHTSRGHKFAPAYRIKHEQILRAFQRYLANDQSPFPVLRSDALDDDVNEWEDYLSIEVELQKDDPEETRASKQDTSSKLPALFESWRNGNLTFEEHFRYELETAGKMYLQAYLDMATRIAAGDLAASLDAPIDSGIVEMLLTELDSDGNPLEQLQQVAQFFASDYFREVPYEYISSGLITVLRDRVREGKYANAEKAQQRLSGLYFDINHIAAHTPYCHAMFVDSEMHDYAADSRLQLTARHGTLFFSKSNMSEFESYLRSILETRTRELAEALDLVYPKMRTC